MVGSQITLSRDLLYKLYWEEGLSLKEIARLLGRHYPVVYRAMKRFGIPRRNLSEALKNYYRRHEPKLKTKFYEVDCEELAYLIGAFLGDGSAYSYVNSRGRKDYRVEFYCGIDRDFAEVIASYMKRMFSGSVLIKYSKKKKYVVYMASKELYDFFTNKDKMLEYANKYPKSFIRGFFDAEGSTGLYKRKRGDYSYGIFIYNNDVELLRLIHEKLLTMGIRSHLYRDKRGHYFLTIYDKASIKRFATLVGSSIERKRKKLEELVTFLEKR